MIHARRDPTVLRWARNVVMTLDDHRFRDHPSEVVVIGSVNLDYVLRLERRPAPGETVSDAMLELHPGGEGS